MYLDICQHLFLRCKHEGELESVEPPWQRYSIWRLLDIHTPIVAWAGLLMDEVADDGLAGAVLTMFCPSRSQTVPTGGQHHLTWRE